MPDCFRGRIKIGGPLNQDRAALLLAALQRELGSAKEVVELVEHCLDTKSVIEIDDDAARNGAFSELEDELIAAKIPFVRESATSHGSNGEIVVFTGEVQDGIMVNCQSEAYVLLDEVEKAFEDGQIAELIEKRSLARWSPEPVAKSAREVVPIRAALAAFRGQHRLEAA